MKTFKVVVLQGDGSGPRLVAQAVRTLRALEPSLRDVGFSIEEYPCGAEEYRRGGMAMRPRTWKSLLASDVILAGPMGRDDVRDAAGLGIQPQLDILERLGLSRKLRSDPGAGVEGHGGEKHALIQVLPCATGAIEAAAMMLDWLGDPETVRGAKRLREIVGRVLQDPAQPELADLVIRELSG